MSDDDKRKSDREPVTLFVEYEGADDLVGDYTENLSTAARSSRPTASCRSARSVQLVLGVPRPARADRDRGHRAVDARPQPRESRRRRRAGAGIEFDAGPGARPARRRSIEKIRSRDPKTVSRLFRVLVVEDNRHVATLIQDGLKGSARRDFGGGVSFVVRSAEDGRQAIEILRRETFDALIIDVYLPVIDGAKVIATARGELGLVDLPIIAVSAGGDSARTLGARGRREHLPRQADAPASGDRHDPAPARVPDAT